MDTRMERWLRHTYMRRQFVRYRILFVARWIGDVFYQVPEAFENRLIWFWHKALRF